MIDCFTSSTFSHFYKTLSCSHNFQKVRVLKKIAPIYLNLYLSLKLSDSESLDRHSNLKKGKIKEGYIIIDMPWKFLDISLKLLVYTDFEKEWKNMFV